MEGLIPASQIKEEPVEPMPNDEFFEDITHGIGAPIKLEKVDKSHASIISTTTAESHRGTEVENHGGRKTDEVVPALSNVDADDELKQLAEQIKELRELYKNQEAAKERSVSPTFEERTVRSNPKTLRVVETANNDGDQEHSSRDSHPKKKRHKKRKKHRRARSESDDDSDEAKPIVNWFASCKRKRIDILSPIRNEVKIIDSEFSVPLLSSFIENSEQNWKVDEPLYREKKREDYGKNKKDNYQSYAWNGKTSTVMDKFMHKESSELSLSKYSKYQMTELYSRRAPKSEPKPYPQDPPKSNCIKTEAKIEEPIFMLNNIPIPMSELKQLAVYNFTNLLMDADSARMSDTKLSAKLLKLFRNAQAE